MKSTFEKPSILLVDDRPENLTALSGVLEGLDIHIRIASSGNEALGLLLQHDCAVVLLDVQMPEMDGFETAELMRQNRRTSHIPIIFVTARDRQENLIFKGYESGAVDYLVKPLEPVIVRNKVRVFVDLYQQRRLLSDQATQLQKANQELERYKVQLEASLLAERKAKDVADGANRAKSEFLAHMSHEIRNPLSTIVGYAEMLSVHAKTEESRKNYVARILQSASNLTTIINDTLDLAKVEAGMLNVELLKISPYTAASEVVELLQAKAEEKGLRLELKTDGAIPSSILTDPTRIRQILMNIVGNALKFTSKGGITLTLRHSKEPSRFYFTVKDTGCGISKDQAERLFSPFTQADSSTTRKYGGTGLGLSLSRQLARALGGDLILKESALDAGSTFEISIDPGEPGVANRAPEQNAPASADALLQGMKVLVVEDRPDNLEMATTFLESKGATVHQAVDGEGGVAKALGGSYDLIFMDMGLPRLDGFGAIRRIRSSGCSTPIVALTGKALVEEKQKCFEAGCNGFLAKPFTAQSLILAAAEFRK